MPVAPERAMHYDVCMIRHHHLQYFIYFSSRCLRSFISYDRSKSPRDTTSEIRMGVYYDHHDMNNGITSSVNEGVCPAAFLLSRDKRRIEPIIRGNVLVVAKFPFLR